jgi:hypothetical protein
VEVEQALRFGLYSGVQVGINPWVDYLIPNAYALGRGKTLIYADKK